MENLPARVPHTLFPDLVSAFIPPDTPPDSYLELVVVIEGENIPAREFAAYLSLIDRLYGRLTREGLSSYAHREWGRLEIAEIHKSELEIIFRLLKDHPDVAALVTILIFLRSLPNMFKIVTEGVKNLADSYKSVQEGRLARDKTEGTNRFIVGTEGSLSTVREDEAKPISESSDEERLAILRNNEALLSGVDQDEGRLARENRKQIREAIKQEPALEQLEEARKSQLTTLLNDLLHKENANLPAPIRFARRQVKRVLLRIGKRASRDIPIIGGHERKFRLGTSEDEE